MWRGVYRIGFPIARRWWRLWQPAHVGALVAVCLDGHVLLVRSSYRSEWNLPGGGVRRGETPVAAAHRELAEEVGLSAPQLQPGPVLRGLWDARPDQVHFFRLALDAPPRLRLDNREIVAARFAAPATLREHEVTRPVWSYLQGWHARG